MRADCTVVPQRWQKRFPSLPLLLPSRFGSSQTGGILHPSEELDDIPERDYDEQE